MNPNDYLGPSLIHKPLLFTCLLGIVSYVTHFIASNVTNKKLTRLSRVYSRSMIILANICMLIGSEYGSESILGKTLSAGNMAVVFAIMLIGTMVIGEIKRSRWLVVTSLSFFIFHFYRQIFPIVDDAWAIILFGSTGLVFVKLLSVALDEKHYHHSRKSIS